MILVNRTARFTHLMAILFASGWGLAILAPIMGDPPSGVSETVTFVVLGVFGMAALCLLVYANRKAAIKIETADDMTIIVTQQTLFVTRVHRINSTGVRDIFVEQSEDQDGAPYFKAVLYLKDSSRLVAREGNDKHRAGEAADLLKAALQK